MNNGDKNRHGHHHHHHHHHHHFIREALRELRMTASEFIGALCQELLEALRQKTCARAVGTGDLGGFHRQFPTCTAFSAPVRKRRMHETTSIIIDMEDQ